VSLEDARQMSTSQEKPIMLVVHKTWCGACKRLGPQFADSKEIKELSRHFIMVNTVDDEEPTGGDYNPEGAQRTDQPLFLDQVNNIGLWNNIWDQFEKLMGFLPSPTPLNSLSNSNNNELSDSSFIVLPYNTSKDMVMKNTTEKEVNISSNNNEQVIQKLRDEIEELKNENDAITIKYETLLKQQNVPNAVKDLLHENTMLKKSISTFRYQVQKHTESMRASIIIPGLTPAIAQSRIPPPQITKLMPPSPEESTIFQLKVKLAAKEKEVKELEKYKKKYDKIMEKAKQKKGSIYIESTTSSGTRSTTSFL